MGTMGSVGSVGSVGTLGAISTGAMGTCTGACYHMLTICLNDAVRQSPQVGLRCAAHHSL